MPDPVGQAPAPYPIGSGPAHSTGMCRVPPAIRPSGPRDRHTRLVAAQNPFLVARLTSVRQKKQFYGRMRDMADVRWKSGKQVMVTSGGTPTIVVGHDSVGSVILQLCNDERLRI